MSHIVISSYVMMIYQVEIPHAYLKHSYLNQWNLNQVETRYHSLFNYLPHIFNITNIKYAYNV